MTEVSEIKWRTLPELETMKSNLIQEVKSFILHFSMWRAYRYGKDGRDMKAEEIILRHKIRGAITLKYTTQIVEMLHESKKLKRFHSS